MVAFDDENLVVWPVAAICAAIELSERTYYAARARPAWHLCDVAGTWVGGGRNVPTRKGHVSLVGGTGTHG